MPRATPLSPDERRRHLVDATLPLLVQHGRAVSTRQIARAAGVAEGTIFRVFDSKDEPARGGRRPRARPRACWCATSRRSTSTSRWRRGWSRWCRSCRSGCSTSGR
nr:helix-turn-helix domain-containing protein [Angustibacter aerolatus]